ncbi:uracil-DNA glycosylase, partial [Mycoplasmopsis alligatoris]
MKYSWLDLLQVEGKKPYFQKLLMHLEKFENEGKYIMPASPDMFKAFDYVQDNNVKVVILGQDPYPGKDVADGLAFSTNSQKTPSSLKNMFKELKKDYPEVQLETNSLVSWAKQGVLLLNTVLTVNEGEANSHANIGWETFTKIVLENVIKKNPYVVFGILGNASKAVVNKLEVQPKNIVFLSHPSPLGYHKSFKDGQFFKKINKIL